MESVAHHGEVCYTAEELDESANSLKRKSGGYEWEWIFRVWDNGGRNMELNRAESVDMDPLSRYSSLTMETYLHSCFFLRCQKFV